MLELASRTTQLEQTADKTDDEDAELDELLALLGDHEWPSPENDDK